MKQKPKTADGLGARPEPGEERKFRGRIHVCVVLEYVAEGDYAELPGKRIRKVAAVRKHRSGEVTLSLEALKSGRFTLDRERRVILREVVAIWRKRATEEDANAG
jgi:hypothetical protein